MRIIDTMPFNDEFDILECRLVEMSDAVDHHIIVEAGVDHQGNDKPFHLTELLVESGRFDRWRDKVTVVRAHSLPSVEEFPDPWAREHAQREWIADGLVEIGAQPHDIVLQSDVDEIPRALHARNVRPGGGLMAFGMRGHYWALDWLHPLTWKGTVAGTLGSIAKLGQRPFAHMRDMRSTAPCPPFLIDAGWHLSWLGGPERATKKLGAFCHPEVADRINAGIADELSFWRDGIHVDGHSMFPVDVDDGWPQWIAEGYAPASWYRPR